MKIQSIYFINIYFYFFNVKAISLKHGLIVAFVTVWFGDCFFLMIALN